MLASLRGRSLIRFGLWLFVSPILAAVGLVVVAVRLPRVARWVRMLPTARAETIYCPQGHANETVSRWECANCGGAQFFGWVGRCSVCGSEIVDWIACSTCGLAILLPWKWPRW